jgi:hypothetical protein
MWLFRLAGDLSEKAFPCHPSLVVTTSKALGAVVDSSGKRMSMICAAGVVGTVSMVRAIVQVTKDPGRTVDIIATTMSTPTSEGSGWNEVDGKNKCRCSGEEFHGVWDLY